MKEIRAQGFGFFVVECMIRKLPNLSTIFFTVHKTQCIISLFNVPRLGLLKTLTTFANEQRVKRFLLQDAEHWAVIS